MSAQVRPGVAVPLRLLFVAPEPRPEAGVFLAAGAEVAAFGCGVSALSHWDAAGPAAGGFDAAVIDEAPEGLSGPTLTLALRAGGFAGPVIGLAGDPGSAAARRWRERGCDLVLPRPAPPAVVLAGIAGLSARGAMNGGGADAHAEAARRGEAP